MSSKTLPNFTPLWMHAYTDADGQNYLIVQDLEGSFYWVSGDNVNANAAEIGTFRVPVISDGFFVGIRNFENTGDQTAFYDIIPEIPTMILDTGGYPDEQVPGIGMDDRDLLPPRPGAIIYLTHYRQDNRRYIYEWPGSSIDPNNNDIYNGTALSTHILQTFDLYAARVLLSEPDALMSHGPNPDSATSVATATSTATPSPTATLVDEQTAFPTNAAIPSPTATVPAPTSTSIPTIMPTVDVATPTPEAQPETTGGGIQVVDSFD